MVFHVRSLGSIFLCSLNLAFIICGIFIDAEGDSLGTAMPESSKLHGARQDSASVNNPSRISKPPQASDTTGIVSLNRVVVTASRRQRLLETSQSLSIIRPDEWVGTSKSIADVVAEQAGVQTRRYGGTGSFQTVSIRGIKGSEVLVLLDGIPLNSAIGGAVDLGKINPMHLAEIEVYRGAVPGNLGGNSIGGVINLKTKKIITGASTDLHTEIGSYGRHRITGGYYYSPTSRYAAYGSISYSHSQNDFPYLDRNNTVYGTLKDPRLDDTVRTMQNNQFTAYEFSVHPSYAITSIDRNIQGGVFISHATAHIPAPEGKVNATARFKERRIAAHLSLQDENSSNSFVLTPRLSYVVTDGLTEWSNKDKGFGASHGGVSKYAKAGIIDQSLGFDCAIATSPENPLRLNGLAFAKAFDGTPYYDRDGLTHGDWNSRSAQGGLASDITLSVGPVEISAGGSGKIIYDETEGGLEPVSAHMVLPADTITFLWSITGGLSLRPCKDLLLFTNAARYANEPSLRERFGAHGAVMANPELKPETGYMVDAGVKIIGGTLYLESSFFFVNTINSILFKSDGYQIRPVNNAGSLAYGLELFTSADINRLVSGHVSLTWQHTGNLQREYKGRRLPDEPDLTIRPAITIAPWQPLRLSYEPEFKSFYYHDRGNTPEFRVPVTAWIKEQRYGHIYHNFRVKWQASENTECILSGKNLILRSTDDPSALIEGAYSWILYPVNEWTATVSVSF